MQNIVSLNTHSESSVIFEKTASGEAIPFKVIQSIVPRKLAILIARGIGTRPSGAIFFCIIPLSCDFVKLCLK